MEILHRSQPGRFRFGPGSHTASARCLSVAVCWSACSGDDSDEGEDACTARIDVLENV